MPPVPGLWKKREDKERTHEEVEVGEVIEYERDRRENGIDGEIPTGVRDGARL